MQILNVEIDQAGYQESKEVIHNIYFSVNKGEFVGLIGPNGAGKSTTIKAILGLLKDMKGKIQYTNAHTYAYIPEQPIYYDELTLWEHLELTASVLEMDRHLFEKGPMSY
ncbi:ATP-binding cassette domain-containing protein [Tepidibacillus marianensis]|uniref:ATP-binding cassette domain-containing protein n=1 Tax=Tepidibacillus marianensis TaxID=3131995 RepID=UPI0030D51773